MRAMAAWASRAWAFDSANSSCRPCGCEPERPAVRPLCVHGSAAAGGRAAPATRPRAGVAFVRRGPRPARRRDRGAGVLRRAAPVRDRRLGLGRHHPDVTRRAAAVRTLAPSPALPDSWSIPPARSPGRFRVTPRQRLPALPGGRTISRNAPQRLGHAGSHRGRLPPKTDGAPPLAHAFNPICLTVALGGRFGPGRQPEGRAAGGAGGPARHLHQRGPARGGPPRAAVTGPRARRSTTSLRA